MLMARTQAYPRAVDAVLGSRRVIFGEPGSVRRPIAFLAITVLISWIIAPSFLTLSNINALLIGSSFLIVLSVGEAVVIMHGMIDLGVESVLASSGMLAAWLYVFNRMPGALAMLVTIIVGIAIGMMAGLLVTQARIPSFIVTLGTYWGFKGVALLFNNGNYISPDAVQPPRELTFLGIASQSFNVSNLIIISVAVVALAQIMMSSTPIGTWMKSVGSNEEAARTVGLNTSRLKIGAFVISGLLAALAGMMITAWQDSIYPASGAGFSLQAIAGVILGGIPFTGGRGTIVGAAIGALIIGVIDDLIVLVGLPTLYTYIFVAIILVIAGLQARGGPFVK
jgi:ribose/xylose/arabinose/galactoside ABC-type transport system permease subunit